MTQERIIMTNKELSRYEIIQKLIRKEINGTEAAKQLALTIRHVKRIKAGVIKEGVKGVIHRGRGEPSNRKIPDENIERIKRIVKQNYHDFGPTFASEKLGENHQIEISHEKLRQLMTDWKLWKPKPRKKNKEYRSWRPRKEQYGEMEQFDGSYHNWFEDRAPKCCLLASVDDATGKPTKLRFVYDEGIIPVFTFWKGYVETHGKPLKIYLDRLSTYKNTHKSVIDDPDVLTQFQRAMQDLDIKLITAYSPQAKGRIERLFGILQDRLVKELRLAGISTIEEANRFVEEVFIPKFNAQFAVLPQRKGNLHRVLTKIDEEDLDRIFSIQDRRVVTNDFTVRHKGKYYQLLETQPTLILRKDRVLVEQRITEELFISLRNKYLNYKLLPGRPVKVKTKVIALTKTKSSWKPPVDHPWRRSFVISKKENQQQLVSVN